MKNLTTSKYVILNCTSSLKEGGGILFKSLKSKKLTSLIVASFMAFNLVSPLKAFAAEDSVNIEVLATSDFHGKFMPWDYATNKEDKTGSLTQLQTIVKGLKQSNPNSIIVDAGDTIQGNSSELFLSDNLHPMMLAMNEMGYDTWSLGNHEFNYGVPTTKKIMDQFKNDVLVANVYEKDGVTRLNNNPGYKIVERPGFDGEKVKVAIIGMVTPNITKWDGKNLEGYKVTNPIDEAKSLIPEIKKETDIIIAVVHMSENNEYEVAGSGSKDLAAAVPELTAIVAAHEHKAMDQTFHSNILTTENKNGAATIAKMNLKVVKKDGKYIVEDKTKDVTSKLIWVQDQATKAINYQPDTDLTTKLQPYHDRAKADAETVIGELKGGDLVPPSEVTGIPTAQVQDTAMIDLINKVQMHYTGAEISSTAMFVSSANIKEGTIQKSGTALIYPYANTLYKVEITGSQLKKYMEWSANYYNTFKPGDLTISFNEKIRAYNYDMFSGVKYEVNVSKESGSRIENLRKMDDTPIKDTDVFIMAVNNYRASSQLGANGEIFKAGEAAPKILEIDVRGDLGGVRELIADYIKNVKGGVITPEVDNNWKIVGNNWDVKQRALAVQLINKGKLKLPLSADGRTPNVSSITYGQALAANKVDIVSFNDFHGSLKEDGKNVGAAKLAGEVAKYKKSNPDTIILSAGDNYQGSAMSNLTYGAPVSEMMKAMGVSLSAVGNHEFDWGVDYISQWAQDGNFDFLASNIYSKTTGKPVTWAKPYKVITQDGLKIGFIGIATPETATKTKPENVNNLKFVEPAVAANEWAAKLKSGELPEGKVDVVIALTHLGSFQDKTTKVVTGEGADLANAVKNVDAIITAHTHQTVNGIVNNIPVVQAYYNGRALANLSLMKDVDGKFIGVNQAVVEIYKKTDLVEDPTVKAIYDKYNKDLAPILDEVVGSTDKELTHDKAQPGVSTLGQWVAESMSAKAGTQIGITNGGGVRISSLPQGDITMGKMYELMPFDNTLVKMELKGSGMKRVLENGIGNTSIGWVQFTGVKAYYDINAELGNRITAMFLMDGTKVDMDTYYTVVTNDFMATGGDGYNFSGAKNVVDTGLPIREAMVEQLKELKAAGKVLSITPEQFAIPGPAPVEVIEVSGVTLNKTTLDLEVGKNETLIATVAPENATNKDLIWTSSDDKVASVVNGVVTAVGAGKATITVKTVDGEFTATCEINAEVKVTGVTLNKTTLDLEVGKNETLIATVAPQDATNKELTWISSDESIATVKDGVVTAVKEGNVTIKVTAAEFTAECTVNVKVASAPVEQPLDNDTTKVIDAVKTAPEKSTINVDITAVSKVSKDVFEAIKGQDKNITFEREGVSFTFNGKDIKPENLKDIDLSLKTVSAELMAKEIAKIKEVVDKDVAIAAFSFNYDGHLPGKATVKVFIGKDWANKVVYINRYFADKNTYKKVAEGTVDAEGNISVELDHFSDYFVMEKADAPNLPQTGSQVDFAVMVNFGAMMLVLGAALVAADIRRKRNIAA
jgi:2',3'-cyclic-nucleotide 2'-phosphodiesterase (5'-nucleotidase family)